MTLHEPDVALTDLALAIECAVLAMWLLRTATPQTTLRSLFVVFFAAVGTAGLLGGIAHGFLPDQQDPLNRAVWVGTLVSIGSAAFACWSAGARLWLGANAAARVTLCAGVLLALDLIVILFVSRSFVVAIVHYLPAAVFLLVSFVMARRQRPEPFFKFGIAGVFLTFVAAGIQQGGIGLHPGYFDSNALYHTVQGCALALIFISARGVIRSGTEPLSDG